MRVFTPPGFVPSGLSGWSNSTINIVISPRLGANFSQTIVSFGKTGHGEGRTEDTELFAYVIEGSCSGKIGGKARTLSAGHYVFVPPKSEYGFAGSQQDTRLLLFEKRFRPLAGHEAPTAVFGDAARVEGVPFGGNSRSQLQVLLEDRSNFDMAVNIFTYQPGAGLPFVESHIMEHGLLMLSGAGIYRLDGDWHPVQAGDAIWMAPHCPQWFAAVGDVPASYIVYKDVNRSAL